MDKKRLLDLAGVPLNEMVAGENLQQLAHTIFQLAEKEAYDNAAEAGTSITHDQILQIAQSILKTLEDGVSDLIRQDFENK